MPDGIQGDHFFYSRSFFKTTGTLALAAGVGFNKAYGFVPAHNWEKYDFGSGPEVKDRMYQSPSPQYEPEPVVSGSEVVMSTMPSDRIIKNYGMGMATYVCDEHGLTNRSGKDLEKHLRNLVSLDLGQKLYLRCDWRDIQSKPGRLDFSTVDYLIQSSICCSYSSLQESFH